MKNENHTKKNGNSAFFWGLIIGALLATLLTTKRGRRVLRELSELSLELIENFIEERVEKAKSKPTVSEQDEELAREDMESDIAEDDLPPAPPVSEKPASEEISEEFQKYEEDAPIPKKAESKPETLESISTPTNGHKKKRLFRGIRR